MKNLITFLFLTCFLNVFASPTVYSLKGTTDDEKWNGHKVQLYGISEITGLVALDSVLIEKNAFNLNGKVDSAGWYVVMIQKDDAKPLYKDFYMGGKLDCKVLKDNIQITGSDINNAYQAFEEKYTLITADLVKLNEFVKANPSDETAKKSFNAAYVTYLKTFRDLSIKTVVDNIGNPLGLHLFKAVLSSLEDEDLQTIFSKAGPEFMKDATVKAAIEKLAESMKVQIGSICPDLKMKSPDGAQISLSQFIGKGNYVLIDFWASWCSPCMKELPNVLECYKLYHPKGFDIVGVSLDEDATAWKGAIEKYQIPWHHMSDLAGWKCEAVTVFAFSGIPHTVLVDPKGIIVAKNLRGEELKAKLVELYK